MSIALFSDIHANREAFEACLSDARRRGASRFVLLGDYVGYGADPVWVLETVADLVAKGAVAVLGNHDAAVGTPDTAMNPVATAALDWTRRQLGTVHKTFLKNLPLKVVEEGRLYVHANGWAPGDWGYITSAVEAERSMRVAPQQWTFCGHTHVPALYHMSPQRPPGAFSPPPNKPVPLAASRRWLAVLGSVGQPRDGNPAACYGLLEHSPLCLTMVRVPYDAEAAARKVAAAGLPDSLGRRLLTGR
ncbi:metallophosphatase family protein [Alsobacter soli]|uniref:Metallophosphatase family protein n=1 Tax=Alsobacter soli TaxID=2109933 RepID=A0A2T1HTI3_9HYPH|nr:metallophosphoesterase family protein [Alsobacter soli]PSC04957.1 metallophosphatase family protein [Alsobacter soli]